MNILIIPEYFNGRNLDAISQMSSFEDLIRGWPNDDDKFFVMVGKETKKFKWSDRSMGLDLGLTTLLQFDVPGDDVGMEGPMSHKTLSTEELNFLLRVNTSPHVPVIDVVINRRREATRLIDYAIQHGANRPILVVSIIGDAKVSKKSTAHREDELDAVVEQVFAAWMPCMFQTEMDRKLMVAEAARSIPAASRKKIRDAPVIHFPMNWDAIPIYEIRKKRRETIEALPRFGYFGSFWAKKRVLEMMDLLERIRVWHPELKMILTTQSPRAYQKYRRPWVEVHVGMTRYDYYSHLHKADIVIVSSTNETTGRAYWEQLISGIDLIFWDAYWLKEFIGDFPFVAKSEKDLQAMVMSIIGDRKVRSEFKLANDALRTRIMDMLDHRSVAWTVNEIVQRLMPKFKTFKFVDALVEQMSPELTAPVTLAEVDTLSKEFTKNGRTIITQNRMVSARQMADSLHKAGFAIACNRR